MVATVVHLVLVALINKFGFGFAPINFHYLIELAIGRGNNDVYSEIGPNINTHFWHIVTYFVISWIICGFAGWLLGRHIAAQEGPNERDLFTSEAGVWILVDVEVEDSIAYRGVYHLHQLKAAGHDGFLALSLTSRRCLPPAKDPASKESFGAFVSNEDRIGLFCSSLSQAGRNEELHDFLRSEDGTEADMRFEGIMSWDPQLIIPWPRIKSINLQHFRWGN